VPSKITTFLSAAIVASMMLAGPPALTGAGAVAGPDRVTVTASSISELRQWDAAVTQMQRSGELRLRAINEDPLLSGRSHERFDQYYKGVRVFGGDVARQMDGALSVSVFGQVYPSIEIDTTPRLSAEAATDDLRQLGPSDLVIDQGPELVILPSDLRGYAAGGYALAYRFVVKTPTDRLVYFLDAGSGAVILQYSNIQRQAAIGKGTGVFGDTKKVSARANSGVYVTEDLLRPPDIATFDMKGNVARTVNFLNGVIRLGVNDLASSTDNVWSDGPDVDGHVYAGYTYDYYFKRFGRHGLDNNDIALTVLIHPARRSDLTSASSDIVSLFYLNAFYAGDGVVVYGEGLPQGFTAAPFHQTVDFFAGGLDIVAHELSHGVTEFSSGLIYMNESGALNEAFSDFMGVSVKFFFEPAGNGPMQANYELGSDVFRPGGIRSLDNPGAFGDPDHYSKRYTGSRDNGGVHTNCTIIDQAFYLAIEGGTNRTSGLPVQGVGAANRDQVEKAFYRAFTQLLTANATISMARAATIQAARDLYGSGSAPERAVTQAWTAVGVN
jgi:bacillolysin